MIFTGHHIPLRGAIFRASFNNNEFIVEEKMISKKALLIAMGLAFVGSPAFAADENTLNAIRQGNEAIAKKIEEAKKQEAQRFAEAEAKAQKAQQSLDQGIEESKAALKKETKEASWYKDRIDVVLKNMEMAKNARQQTLDTAQSNLGKKIARHNQILRTIRNNRDTLRASAPKA